MSSITDPEVRELVEAVLSDPESTLTRRPTSLRQAQPVSSGEPWLTKAERHLLRAHRESVAALLYQACQQALLGGAVDLISFCRRTTFTAAVKPLDVDIWRARAAHEIEHGIDTTDEVSGLARCMPAKTALSASEIALLSLRLHPKDETRLWLGLALLSENRRAPAVQCFQEVLEGRSGLLNHAIAMVNLAFISLHRGHTLSAFNSYDSVVHTNEDVPAALVGLMHTSVLTQNRTVLLSTARTFQELASSFCEIATEYRSALHNMTITGVAPALAARNWLRSCWDQIPQVARQVLEPLRRSAEEDA